jgi:nucleoside-diphosphate-sugar epimerase
MQQRRQYGTDFRSVMPTNLYGPGDNFHPENSHVLPSLIRRFHEAVARGDAEVMIWGSGKLMREFMHVDDMAKAVLFVMDLNLETYQHETQERLSHINVGTGIDMTIRELAETVARVTGFVGKLAFDATKPDGAPRKLLDVAKLSGLGWRASIGLDEGLQDAYRDFVVNG